MAPMSLVAGGGTVPASFRRGDGEAGEGDGVAEPREATAQPDGARARREVRLEVAGVEEREGRRRKRSSGGHRAKRRVGRGRGGGCNAVGGDGATGRRSGEEGEAAGGGRRHGREGRTAGRGDAATGKLGKGLKRENARRGFRFIGEEREPATGGAGNGGGVCGRRPWKVAGVGASVPGDWGRHSRGN